MVLVMHLALKRTTLLGLVGLFICMCLLPVTAQDSGTTMPTPAAPATPTPIPRPPPDNVLNQNFTISLATNNGVDLTANYSGYLFKMMKTDYYHGPCTATKGSTVYTGTWSSNSDYSKLVITLPSSPTEFVFLNREWKLTACRPPRKNT